MSNSNRTKIFGITISILLIFLVLTGLFGLNKQLGINQDEKLIETPAEKKDAPKQNGTPQKQVELPKIVQPEREVKPIMEE